ncbi:MAG: FAD/NAD(P)-binding protein [Dehalococcoidia bacterium]|nr:FAD/NAD(P)-binding protein [Planctomycetota bacterium]MCK6564936.1 FAD/NAD(P)-binding protein [Dehalococcoidia bacterium]
MMLAPVRDPMTPTPARIRKVRRETSDTFTVHLDVDGRDGGFRFAPGQFNMLYVFGVGEVPISISGDPGAPSELVHTIRAVGTVTRAIQKQRKASVLGVRGPFGQGWPLDKAKGGDLLLVAGGLGLAPLRPAVYHVLEHREDFRDVSLLVGARTPEDLLFRSELSRWQRKGRIQVLVTVDRATPDWKGPIGVVPPLLREARFEPGRTLAFACGPEVMLRFTEHELSRLGLGADQLYFSLERNMKCAVGFCGHCQLGPAFLCKDGPVLRYDRVRPFFLTREA